MKQIIKCLLLIIFIIALITAGCTKNQNEVQINENQETDHGVEHISYVVKTVDELKAGIVEYRKNGSENSINLQNKLSEMKYFYEPAVEFKGYSLYQIEVNENRVFYYYIPQSIDADKVEYFDYETGIVVTICRVESENPLEGLIKQSGISPNKDSILFDSEHNSLTWAEDKTWIDIRFPKSFTSYDDMIVYCKVNKVTVIE